MPTWDIATDATEYEQAFTAFRHRLGPPQQTASPSNAPRVAVGCSTASGVPTIDKQSLAEDVLPSKVAQYHAI